MKLCNFILIFIASLIFYGCTIGPATYEIFEKDMNYLIGSSWLPDKKYREIYSDDKYIYKIEILKGCHIGFLTNRDDRHERVRDWFIISGKEFCKEQQAYGF